MYARFDKLGKRLPDTGHGCGCRMCADSNAPRYERRQDPDRAQHHWSPLRRSVVRLVRSLRRSRGSPEVA
jgi:hypothetical protein